MSFEIPIGPQHPIHVEPLMLKLKVEGELIVDVDIDVSYIHRGIEKALELRSYPQGLFLAERICGICNCAHSLCYCLNIEQLLGKEAPPRAKYLRVIVEELSRVHSHLLWLGHYFHTLGFETLFMYFWRDRERVMDMLELMTGNRVTTSYNVIGGVRRDITPEIDSKLRRMIEHLRERMKYYEAAIRSEPSLLGRLQGVGLLKPEDAIRLGTVGPHLRASGVKHDVRLDDPYSGHEEIPFNVITYDTCDCYGRVMVRIGEVFESLDMIAYALDHLPSGEYRLKMPPFFKAPVGESLSRVEAPRGELIHYSISDGGTNPFRYRVRTPTLANLASVAAMLKSRGDYEVYIADVPAILGGIDPCICCTARVIITDEGKKTRRITTLTELERYARERGVRM
ncbi:MAG: nickel-dependent hydrogenase large subunit [Aigarchaeota archaeon]|nr:nickel-dependent hydrogenase large subunit [Aigarchaeota archaeon]MDW8021225.1 nickel-dependent hydrogenase large subunit [Nitrososphaerota archaeon]